LPLTFEENRGQSADDVRFLARGPGYRVFLRSADAVIGLSGRSSVVERVVQMRFVGGSESARAVGEEQLEARSHCFRPDRIGGYYQAAESLSEEQRKAAAKG
jgi:hypothetical protein